MGPRSLRRLRRPSLRPVLLLVVVIFVLIPLAVYHVATFDFQRVASLERRSHLRPPSSEPVPACLSVASADFLRPDALRQLQARCGLRAAVEPPKSRSQLRLVHFVHVAQDWDAAEEDPAKREQFTYLQFAALQSVRRAAARRDDDALPGRAAARLVHAVPAPSRAAPGAAPVAFDASLPRHKRRRITGCC